MKVNLLGKKSAVIVGVLLLILLSAVPSYYFYKQYQKVQKQLLDPALAAKEQTFALVVAVGKLIELPKGEDPTVATISDKEKLKDQPFFNNAKNGDKIIIYTNAKKAILYDPVANKIIDVAPVNIGSPSATITTIPAISIKPSPSSKSTPKPTL